VGDPVDHGEPAGPKAQRRPLCTRASPLISADSSASLAEQMAALEQGEGGAGGSFGGELDGFVSVAEALSRSSMAWP
jgi:hypothetical protein